VDDDTDLRDTLVEQLSLHDEFEASAVDTGAKGASAAKANSPDLVLMDVSLPGMDGLCATKDLKADPLTRHLIIVGLTAHAMKGDEAIALDAGCDGYLTKPINTRTFVATVTDFIASAHSPQKTTA